jgi:hypothetical protein
VSRVVFHVVRRCEVELDVDCTCHLPIAEVGVDELAAAELEAFARVGDIAQRAEASAWLAELAAPDCDCGGRCRACDPDSHLDARAELLAGQRDW